MTNKLKEIRDIEIKVTRIVGGKKKSEWLILRVHYGFGFLFDETGNEHLTVSVNNGEYTGELKKAKQ